MTALLLTCATLIALLVCNLPAHLAMAAGDTTITPLLSPDLLNAKGALTLTINYGEGEDGIPPPVRELSVKFPIGLSLNIPNISGCSVARLRSHGPRGCAHQSELGSGHALVEAAAGSQRILEDITLWVFLGPPRGLQPTFDVFGEGYTPLQERLVLGGTVAPASAPYGEELVMNVPPIPTLPLEPNASIASLTLTVGTSIHRLAPDANTIVVPGSCPTGGFPFAGEFTYATGTTGSALATTLCPRQ
jgi:hypothetical protein